MVKYNPKDDHRMEQIWATWVRGLTGVSLKELNTIKSLWHSEVLCIDSEIATGVSPIYVCSTCMELLDVERIGDEFHVEVCPSCIKKGGDK